MGHKNLLAYSLSKVDDHGVDFVARNPADDQHYEIQVKTVRNLDYVYILSAKYGLVEETDVIAPYDLTLADLPEHGQSDWANYVLAQMGERFNLEHDTFLILAGRRYYQHLLPRLPHTILPLGNLPIGARVAFLQRQMADTSACNDSASRCLRLHQLLATLPRYTWEEIDEVPFRNGIYLVFEEGERVMVTVNYEDRSFFLSQWDHRDSRGYASSTMFSGESVNERRFVNDQGLEYVMFDTLDNGEITFTHAVISVNGRDLQLDFGGYDEVTVETVLRKLDLSVYFKDE